MSPQIKCIFLRIHQYQVRIIYKPGLEVFITDWLSRHNHMENKDEEMHGMDVRVDAIQMSMNIPECMSIPQIQQVTVQDEHLQWLKREHHCRMARNERLGTMRHKNLLVIQRCHDSD